MKRLIFLLLVLTMVPVTTVMAKNSRHARDIYVRDSPAESYVTIKLGVFMPNEDSDFLDDGFAIGGAIGHKFNRNFALEVGLDNVSTDFDDGYGYEDVNVNILGIPVTAKLVAPLSNQLEFYAGGGFGVYFTNVEDDYVYYDGYYYDDGADDTSLGFHTLLGADIKMNPNMALNMEVRYTQIEHDHDEYYYDDFEVGGTTASIGLKFLF